MSWLLKIATLGPLGYMPFPGTVATIVSFLVLYPVRVFSFSLYVACTGVIFLIGYQAVKHALGFFNYKDPSVIVWDEVIGCAFSLLIIPVGFKFLFLNLAFFRFFDGVKPFGIHRLESIPGAWGVILDDVVAGFCSGALVAILYAFKFL